MTVMTPSDEDECRQMLYTAFQMNSPVAVRYPRGTGPGAAIRKDLVALPLGKGEIRRKGRTFALLKKKIAILAFGPMLKPALEAGEVLDATVANMRFVKPLDEELVRDLASVHDLLVTVEEGVISGGAGSAVLEALHKGANRTPVLQLGLPDRFIDQGDPAVQLTAAGLDRDGIVRSIRDRLSA
jgi:1-deoxy-D-xylulose-5-phosphate synthase